MKNKLSNKPSKAIKQALKDLKACIEDPNYLIDFDDWHEPLTIDNVGQFGSGNNNKVCRVCFAGSVMAKTFESPIDKIVSPSDFSEKEKFMFTALDFFRRGRISAGLIALYGNTKVKKLIEKHNLPETVEVNQGDQDQFFTDMKYISKLLKEAGL